MLPHAGQIYRYAEAEAVFVGLEAAFSVDFFHRFNYRFSGEYIYTYNCDEHIPLSFSPPASMRNVLTWRKNQFAVYAEWQAIASQNRVDRNEDRTPGTDLFHLGGTVNNTDSPEYIRYPTLQSSQFLPEDGDTRTGTELSVIN